MKVIKIENLCKEYRLGIIGHGTLANDLQSWWARIRGKEDPNSKIASMLKGQEKQFAGNRFRALHNIDLEVNQGEILGIIGKNGAGKSTLLKILSRVTAPTKGTIKVRGRIASLLEVGTGFHPELTGRENVFMNGAILGMKHSEIKEKFDEIVDFSGVEQFIDTPVKRYSSGMYVRLAFAVAAHLEPEILLVDEVLAVGDAEFQKKCLGKMKDVTYEGRTVIFVSHNMGAVKSLCSHGVYIKNGTISLSGGLAEVIDAYLTDSMTVSKRVDLAKRKDRHGNGNVQVTKMEVNFDERHGLWKIRVSYKSSLSLWTDACLLVSIRRTTGEILTFLDSECIPSLSKHWPGKGEVEILLSPDVRLVNGDYLFNVACLCRGEIIDHVTDAYYLQVIDAEMFGWRKPPKSIGLCMIRQDWIIRSL